MYSPEERVRIQSEICERIANGESLIKICKSDGMPRKNTVLSWLIESASKYASEIAGKPIVVLLQGRTLTVRSSKSVNTAHCPQGVNASDAGFNERHVLPMLLMLMEAESE